jgi:hypothetical protein
VPLSAGRPARDDGPMSAGLAPLTGIGTTPTGTAGAALLVALLVGVVAGRSRRRGLLLLGGLVAALVIGFAVTATRTPPPPDKAAELTALYTTALPLAVAFLAGWLCARGSWFSRLLVLIAATALVLLFPYAEAGRATAAALLGAGP